MALFLYSTFFDSTQLTCPLLTVSRQTDFNRTDRLLDLAELRGSDTIVFSFFVDADPGGDT